MGRCDLRRIGVQWYRWWRQHGREAGGARNLGSIWAASANVTGIFRWRTVLIDGYWRVGQALERPITDRRGLP
jgi:hypothetical protein